MRNLVVYYDGNCKLCNSVKDTWARLDSCNNLIFKSFRDENVKNKLPFDESLLEKEMYGELKETNVYVKGIDTFIEMNKRIPILFLSVPVMILSQKIGIGEKVYRYVADKRKLLPLGQCESGICRI